MDQSNTAKMATTKAPQLAEMDPSATTDRAISPVERHLGLIKVMAIIMAVLIFAALAVIAVTNGSMSASCGAFVVVIFALLL